jgi:UDP-GlcNAc:undecaprenyl-phosphate GlcNAc-1-phosphate transferase
MHYLHAVYAFLVATAVAAALTPFAGRLARKVGAIAMPSDRGLSRKPTPEMGGLAILAAVLLAAWLWLPDKIPLAHAAHSNPGSAGVVHTWTVLAGGALIALIGAIDDALALHPLLKLLGQIGAAIIAAAGGAVINSLTLPFIGGLQFTDAAGPLSVVWLVVLMNIVNLSDGLDGLAAGVCAIDGAAFALIAFNLQGGGSYAAVLAAMVSGGALGFLFHNRYPASIFMGDTGSLLLGYLLGVVAIIGSLKTNAVVALAVPLLVLAVPFMDTGFVVAKRLKYRKAPWQADAEHFHHRMARIGFSEKKTVAYLYAWTLMLAGVALALRFVPYKDHNVTGHYHLGWSVVMGAILLLALIASVYLVYVLEIFKFKSLRTVQLRRVDPDTSDFEIIESVERDIETGEFDALRDAQPDERDEDEREEQ